MNSKNLKFQINLKNPSQTLSCHSSVKTTTTSKKKPSTCAISMWPIKISIKTHNFQRVSVVRVVTNAVKIVTSHTEKLIKRIFQRISFVRNDWWTFDLEWHHITFEWMFWHWLYGCLSKNESSRKIERAERNIFSKINVHRFIIRRWKVHWKWEVLSSCMNLVCGQK